MRSYAPAVALVLMFATCLPAYAAEGVVEDGLLKSTERNLLIPIRRMLAGGKIEDIKTPATYPAKGAGGYGAYKNGGYGGYTTASPEPILKSPKPKSPKPKSPQAIPSPEPSPDFDSVTAPVPSPTLTRSATEDDPATSAQATQPLDTALLAGSSSSKSSGSELSAGGKAGAVIGTLIGAAVLAALGYVVYKRSHAGSGRGGGRNNGLLMNEMSRYRYDRADL